VLVARDMSGFVAHDLSGFLERFRRPGIGCHRRSAWPGSQMRSRPRLHDVFRYRRQSYS
jgi:hypothetical protein